MTRTHVPPFSLHLIAGHHPSWPLLVVAVKSSFPAAPAAIRVDELANH
jgi:hypothetical protein